MGYWPSCYFSDLDSDLVVVVLTGWFGPQTGIPDFYLEFFLCLNFQAGCYFCGSNIFVGSKFKCRMSEMSMVSLYFFTK